MKIFIDLDGVMADFETYFEDYYGFRHDSVSDAEMWKHIGDHENFFGNLPLMADAKNFYDLCQSMFGKSNVFILTACPKSFYSRAAIQKIDWVHSHLDADAHVLPVLGGKNKCLFMHKKNDILVDDFIKNIIPWNDRGGIGIHHDGDFNKTTNAIMKSKSTASAE